MERILKTLLFGYASSLFWISASAQQDAQFTQYMYNTNLVNPAYAGSRGVASMFAVYRAQWVGMAGAPKTFAMSFHTPFVKKNMGIGLSVTNDQVGIVTESNVHLDYSYAAKLNKKYKLAFGLKATANMLSLDYSRLDPFDQQDQTFSANLSNRLKPNFGTGVYLHSDRMYAGLSVSNLLANDIQTNVLQVMENKRMNFYLLAGYVLDLNRNLKFKPAGLLRVVEGAPLQADFSANFMYKNKFVYGLGYRLNAAFNATLGMQFSPGFFAGYAYDFETTSLARYNSGSHEVFLRYELIKSAKNVISPRFF